MTAIIPSSELRNSYPKVSEMCRNTSEPVYLTINGHDDTVIMSVAAYEEISRLALLYKIEEGIRQMSSGKYISKDEALNEIERLLGQ